MKRPATPWTSEQFADLLRLSQQFSDDEARITMERWRLEAGDTAEVSRFIRWLIARGYMTESQANDMLRNTPVSPGPQPVPAVPIAQAPPSQRPESPAGQVMKAAIVAQAVNPVRPVSPHEADIDVELVGPPIPIPAAPPAVAAAPSLDAEIFGLLNPSQSPTTDDVVSVPLEPPAPVSKAAAVEKAPRVPPLDWTNMWLYLFLGALGLLAVEFAGWVLAQVAARILNS